MCGPTPRPGWSFDANGLSIDPERTRARNGHAGTSAIEGCDSRDRRVVLADEIGDDLGDNPRTVRARVHLAGSYNSSGFTANRNVTALPSEVKRARRPSLLGEDAQHGRDGVVISLKQVEPLHPGLDR